MADSSQDHISQYLSDARKRGCLACSSNHCPDSLRVPIRVRRPPLTREALRGGPLMEARRVHSSRVERIPLMTTGARPAVVLAGCPAAQRAPDTRSGWFVALFFVEFAIQDHGRFGGRICEGSHVTPLCPSSDARTAERTDLAAVRMWRTRRSDFGFRFIIPASPESHVREFNRCVI